MTTTRLTSVFVRDLPMSESGTRYFYDDLVKGFGLSVGKRSKTYFAETRVKGHTRRVKIGSSSIFTAEEARKDAKKKLGQMLGGVDLNREKAEKRSKHMTFGEALDTFLKERDLSPRSLIDYRSSLTNYLGDWLPKELRSITPNAVLERFRKITKENGANTANKVMRYFRAVWNYIRAITIGSDGYPTLPDAPTIRISAAKAWHPPVRRKTRILDNQFPDWFRAVIEAQSAPLPETRQFGNYLELLMRTGMRKNEALGLLWVNIDFEAKTFTVVRTKNGHALTLPMIPELEAIFERQMLFNDTPFVFPNSKGTAPMQDPRKSLKRIIELSGISFSYHDLRRTFITIAERQEISPYALKKLVNHSTSGDVTAGYIVDDPERLRAPLAKVTLEMNRLAGMG